MRAKAHEPEAWLLFDVRRFRPRHFRERGNPEAPPYVSTLRLDSRVRGNDDVKRQRSLRVPLPSKEPLPYS